MADTVQLVEEQLEGLSREKAGYAARLAARKAGRVERLNEEQLGDRLKQVEDEEKRLNALLKKAA